MVFPVVMYGCESWTRKKAVDGQSVPKKVLNITDYERNANQNHSELSPHTC